MARRKPLIDLAHCKRLIKKRCYRDALDVFNRSLDKLIKTRTSPQIASVAKELKKVVALIEAGFRTSYFQEPEITSERVRSLDCSFCGKNQNEVRKLIAGPSVQICDECVELCDDIVREEVEAGAGTNPEAPEKRAKEDRLCGICMEPRDTDELIFLPHAAYMCAGCLEEIQLVRDKQAEK